MKPVLAVSSRQGAVGGGLSLILHAGLLAAGLWGMRQVAVPSSELAVEVALVSVADTGTATPTLTSAPTPAPASVPVPALTQPSPPKAVHPIRPPAPQRAVPSPVPVKMKSAPRVPDASPPSEEGPSEPVSEPMATETGEVGGEPHSVPVGTTVGAATATGAATGARGGAAAGGREDADLRAEPLDTPPPSYPLAARRRGLEGRVLLRIGIDERGQVAAIDLAASSGSETLDDAAVAAVRQWRFRPERRDRKSVAATILVPIRFQLGGVVVARSE
ncbi:energy transducer TonB [Magnetospirillum molischianum]|uniref:Putative TonB-like n=1 Tax=Magnetospirillum molischianum DSM 120 TaxID=1150626 RepID=H8FUF0_MAGML|nr:energy transducer TonB [Magnetospirillum molischianum]CCG41988.1 putative TonB-like [Magnetospirillum molischianum DSM 120]